MPFSTVFLNLCISKIIFLEQGSANIFYKDQRVNHLDFVGWMVSVATTSLCPCNMRTTNTV